MRGKAQSKADVEAAEGIKYQVASGKKRALRTHS